MCLQLAWLALVISGSLAIVGAREINNGQAEQNHQDSLQYDLRLISVVFRHGDRAPDPVEIFPKDPHFNDTYYPMGLGGLTNRGKRRAYNLGRFLRQRYDRFLGDTYLPNSVDARSTDYIRTKQCLQLVLSSLYPPEGLQRWHESLSWQPTALTYEKAINDSLLIPEECPKYLQERQRAVELPELKTKLESFSVFMEKLTDLTGKKISTPNDMYNLYHILMAEKSMEFQLPPWTSNYFPTGKLLDGIKLEYEIFSYTPLMRRLNGGMLLKKMVDDMSKTKQGQSSKKIFLYSGHETNIAALLQTLNLFNPHVPAYSSAVIVEFYERKSEFFVKLLYYKSIPDEVQHMQLKDCEEYCQFEKFIQLNRDMIPEGDDMICVKEPKIKEPEPRVDEPKSNNSSDNHNKISNEIPIKRRSHPVAD